MFQVSDSLHTVCCGLFICPQEEASLMMAERGTGLCVYQSVIGVVLWLYFVGFFLFGFIFVFRTVVFGFTLGYLVSGYWSPKQCQVWILSYGVALSQIRHWLAAPTSFVPPLP